MRLVITILCMLITLMVRAQSKPVKGFTRESAEVQLAAEKQFDSYLNAANLDQWMKRLTARPHPLGSPYGKQNAEYVRDLFRSWGYEAEIETYKVLFPTPKTRLLEMSGELRYKARLEEPALKEDGTSNQKAEQLPTYHAWSADGDVSGQLVFVNYGVPDDYEELARMGIDVKGKIVIAKYGGSWRGIKPKVAQERGAIGCIVYSDPMEDGYYQGDVYPEGAFKNKFGVQRGSVMDMPVYPGDPLTPGYGATDDAKRLKREEATNLIKIPVIPISYSDAQPLLEALRGPVAPRSWRGALPITYHVGPSKAIVRLKLEFNWNMVDCHNVIARMKGSELPDEWVIRGNHRDAWVNGAADPISGMVALMEEARAVSELLKTGWKPKRTLIYCAWDGEEPGLIGSTEWVEHHAAELRQKAVAYINSDGNGRGFLGAQGSHTFETLMTEIAQAVTDPQTGVSVFDRLMSRQAISAGTAKARKEAITKRTLTLGALGSGSDYSPFIQHLGIPSLNLGYGGENAGGEYHSIYDSYDHFKRFKDPKFEYGVVLAKTAGRATLRIANADMLPFDFRTFQRTVSSYASEVMTLLESMREATEIENQLIDEKRFIHAADPTIPYFPPAKKDQVPYLNFSSLQNALASLDKAVNQFADLQTANPKPNTNLNTLNKLLYQAEQQLLTDTGLPRRGWYRHTIYAPGFYTGYGVKTLPGIREAIEQRSWQEAQEQIEIAAEAIGRYANTVEQATRILMMR